MFITGFRAVINFISLLDFLVCCVVRRVQFFSLSSQSRALDPTLSQIIISKRVGRNDCFLLGNTRCFQHNCVRGRYASKLPTKVIRAETARAPNSVKGIAACQEPKRRAHSFPFADSHKKIISLIRLNCGCHTSVNATSDNGKTSIPSNVDQTTFGVQMSQYVSITYLDISK